MGSKLLEFVPISSTINPSFWNKVSEIKLNEDKLNEVRHPIWGYFSNINNKCKVPIVEVDSTSFNMNFESQKIYIPFHGKILNKNTMEQFKDCDKTEILIDIGREVFESIQKEEALQIPSLLNQFFILSFADLKKFNFYYWFAFPVPRNLLISCNTVKTISDDFTIDQLNDLWDKYCELDNCQKPYFLVYLEDEAIKVSELKLKLKNLDAESYVNYYFGFYDISLLENCPSSTLRNYVTLILYHCPFLQGKSVNFLSLRLKRDEDSSLTISSSLIFNLELPICQPTITDFINRDPEKVWVGWEKNERGKLGPRLSNMKSFLDPKELAESSVDLNLKLMKWRLLSNIDLEKIKLTKFLLLGSGTLGCSVARILLGWGARHISFVDNSIVSYSNPVRQSLYTFEDSTNAKPKSVAAADNLRKIFPGVKSRSFQLTIPMPGHSVGESTLEQVKKDVEMLTNLIQEHDVIFLLMDSRESRWLPTVLGTYYNKTVINSALGFDSYLVMRHGVKVDLEEFNVRQHPAGFKSLKGNFLGCYFCNDVTAPGNSMKDRTLDQQCTVTRPGVSAIAGALSAELAISILQHKEGAKAPAFFRIGNVANTEKELDNQCVLGLIPHSIRGYLSTFSQVMPATERYKLCVACSDTVQQAYGENGFNFLLEVFQNSKYLEDITGLSSLTREAEEIGVWEFSDEEEIECTNYEVEEVSEVDAIDSVESNRSKGEVAVENFCLNEGNIPQLGNAIPSKLNTNDRKNDASQKLGGSDKEKKSEDSIILSTAGECKYMRKLELTQKMKTPSNTIVEKKSFFSRISRGFLGRLLTKEKVGTRNEDLFMKNERANISSRDSRNLNPANECTNIENQGDTWLIAEKSVEEGDRANANEIIGENAKIVEENRAHANEIIDGHGNTVSTTEILIAGAEPTEANEKSFISIGDDKFSISRLFVRSGSQDYKDDTSDFDEGVSSTKSVMNASLSSTFDKVELMPSQEVLIIKSEQLIRSSSHSSSEKKFVIPTVSTNINLPLVPKELLPILKKQRDMKGTRFGLKQQGSIKFKDDIISLKSKVKNYVSSVGLIGSREDTVAKYNSQKEDTISQPSELKNDIIIVKPKVNALVSTDSSRSSEHDYQKSSDNKESRFVIRKESKILEKHISSYGLRDAKASNFNIVTLKSRADSFISSDSIRSTDFNYKESAESKISFQQNSMKTKELHTLLTRNLISSESLSVDEISKEDKNSEKIMILANPLDHFNFDSSASENLGMEESIYYLAETDSEKDVAEM